jgi:hypothetical protein
MPPVRATSRSDRDRRQEYAENVESFCFRQTIGQIIDEIPIQGHYYGQKRSEEFALPDIEHRTSSTEEGCRLATQFCDSFDPTNLTLETQVIFDTNMSHAGQLRTRPPKIAECRGSSSG